MKDATLKQAVKIMEIFGNLSTEKMQAIISSGLLADLRDGNVSEVDRDDFRVLLGLDPLMKKFLKFFGTVIIPARKENFVARDNFVVSNDKFAKVKISQINADFKEKLIDKIEEPIAESTIRRNKLLKSSMDTPIIKRLGGIERVEVTLSEMFGCMEMQPNGEEGILITNGYANIFYVRDCDGIPWATYCSWRGYGWVVVATAVDFPHEWVSEDSVFSRNPSES